MDSMTVTATTAGVAAVLLVSIALSMSAFATAELIRPYVRLLWVLCPRSLTRWALMAGFVIPALNILCYSMGDLVGVDLRVGFDGDGATPILLSLVMIMVTWWIVVAAIGLTSSAAAGVRRRAERERSDNETR